ncbi:hypothetical protein [Pseudonocardia adelaidensis]|uniref:Uncharacterized protein n=1 Tax=Pseudonocardia adelaidensis TaxID=648754 RepID=A0ABP9N7K8_9PSEU
MDHPPPEAHSQRNLLDAMRAVLSDDHSYERGLTVLRDLVDQIAGNEGAAGLCDFAVALSLGLAEALERIAQDQELAAADLAEIWFTD